MVGLRGVLNARCTHYYSDALFTRGTGIVCDVTACSVPPDCETGQVDRQQWTVPGASAERCDVTGARRQGRDLT